MYGRGASDINGGCAAIVVATEHGELGREAALELVHGAGEMRRAAATNGSRGAIL